MSDTAPPLNRSADAPNASTEPSESAVDPGHPNRRWVMLAVVALAQLMVVLDGTIVNIALPAAQIDLGMSDSDRSWVVTLYALAFGSLLLLGGRIADYWGRKRSFIVGMIGFAAASALGGFAVSGEMLLVARGLQGVFAALLAPAALALLSVTFPKGRERTRAFAVYGTVAGSGAAVGLLLGGVLTEYLSWHWCLLVNVPIALVAIIAAVPLIRESRADGDTKYDIPGAALITAGLASIVYGFSRAELGWVRVDTIGFLALGVLLVAAFIWWEGRSKNPLLPLRVILNRVRGGAYLTSMLVGAALLGALLYLTIYFQLVLGMTALQSGLASLPMAGSIILGAPIVTKLLPQVGPRLLMTVGPLFAAAGLFWLSGITVDGNYAAQVLPGQILLGLGLALVFVPMQNVALSGIEPRDAGVAGAALTATQQIGGSIGTAVFTALYAAVVASAAPGSSPFAGFVDGYSTVFLAAGVGVLIAAPISWFMVKVPRSGFAADPEALHVG
ncbi:MFS transporter [Subtercola boreus]|uniref:MFS transporter n=1 Tax=Subtercola boreus TaxID=120213 RepID=A0A3E0VK95_9MICO|nr:MFS transporter [Subtercola boreus]RFA10306.1 MFS transporter [Subtercola boreus]TQL56190.1 EmrB/QacA subfamily drug resistance transporter [Subtercola boreus]